MSDHIWRFLFTTGVILVILCFLVQIGVGREWMGKLPGDILFYRGNLRIYCPIGVSAIGGAAITLILWLFRK